MINEMKRTMKFSNVKYNEYNEILKLFNDFFHEESVEICSKF